MRYRKKTKEILLADDIQKYIGDWREKIGEQREQ
jgi:hypothetical protein